MIHTQSADVKKENELKKVYLNGYQRAKRQVQVLEEELQELQLNVIAPSVIQDGMPHASGGGDLSGYAAKRDELEHKLYKARYKQITLMKEIRDRINWLEDESEKDVLTYRYIRGYKWEDIAVKLGYSWQWIHKLHARALKNFKF